VGNFRLIPAGQISPFGFFRPAMGVLHVVENLVDRHTPRERVHKVVPEECRNPGKVSSGCSQGLSARSLKAITDAAGFCVAAAFAARSSGVPFFDRRGFWEWTRRLEL
jgi:hypothetical protein